MLTTLGRILLLTLLGMAVYLRHRRLQGDVMTIPPMRRLALWFAFLGALGVAAYLSVGHPHA